MFPVELHALVDGDAGVVVPLPVADASLALHDAFDPLPHGIYSALRTYGGHRFLRLDAHLLRCERSVRRAGWNVEFDLARLRTTLGQLVRARPGDKLVRFELLEHPLDIDGASSSMLVGIAPHSEVPKAILERGASLGLAPSGLARPVPLVKFSDWVVERRICERHDPAAFEWLLLDDQRRILEGTSSNFHALVDGCVVTAGDGVLEGITGAVVRELLLARGVPLRFERLPLAALGACSEAFITSSSREVVPVSSVDGVPIGRGVPGPFTTALREGFRAYAEANAHAAG